MEPWAVAVVVLLAVLVGAAVPVLIQLGTTLRSARRLIDSSGPKLERLMVDVNRTAAAFSRVGTSLEDSIARSQDLIDAAADIGRTMKRMRRSLRIATAIGSAVGPAVLAALRAVSEPAPTASAAQRPSTSKDATTAHETTTTTQGETT